MFTKVGDDPFGEYVRHKLELFGVDTRFVGIHPSMPTPLAFAAMDPPEDPKLLMYRYPMGPDQTLQASEIDRQAVDRRADPVADRCLVQQGAGPRDVLGAAVGQRPQAARRVRPRLPRQLLAQAAEAASADISPVLDHVTVARRQPHRVRGRRRVGDPPEAARRLLDRGVELAIVKMGGEGVMVATSQGTDDRAATLRQGRRRASVPAMRSAACWCTGCCRAGIPCASSSTATSPARSWRHGCCAATPCPRSAEVEEALEDRRVAG